MISGQRHVSNILQVVRQLCAGVLRDNKVWLRSELAPANSVRVTDGSLRLQESKPRQA